MEVLSASTSKTQELAKLLALKLKPKDILVLKGELGSGKTTFTNFLVASLGINKRVQSPTFVLHRRYAGGEGLIKIVNHFDLYRITSLNEAIDLNLTEIFEEESAISVIEWPDIASSILPDRTITINFEYIDENKRKINVQNLH